MGSVHPHHHSLDEGRIEVVNSRPFDDEVGARTPAGVLSGCSVIAFHGLVEEISEGTGSGEVLAPIDHQQGTGNIRRHG